jgi:hypothetical protein
MSERGSPTANLTPGPFPQREGVALALDRFVGDATDRSLRRESPPAQSPVTIHQLAQNITTR